MKHIKRCHAIIDSAACTPREIKYIVNNSTKMIHLIAHSGFKSMKDANAALFIHVKDIGRSESVSRKEDNV